MPDQRRLLVHVGLQKTGTSYLQAALLSSVDALAEQGLDLVPPTKRESYELMVVVRDRYASRRDAASDRETLARFTRQLADARGDRAVYSQESLAAARPDQIQRLLAAAGDREVHVIATVRDLARQLPSSWQQELKAGSDLGYRPYLRRLRKLERAGSGAHPWIHLDPPAVLERWADALAPERVHVITVPPPGSDPTALLRRFATVLEVDPAGLTPEDKLSNSSLGRVQAEVLRRVNAALPERVHRRQVYGSVGKRFFAARVLADQQPRRILVPRQFRAWCDDVTARQVERLVTAGYHLEGSWDELACLDGAFTDEERPPRQREVADAAVQALATMLTLRADGEGRDESTSVAGRLLGRRRGRRRR